MDSGLTFNSYERYREDTTLFLKWLAKDAAALECVLPAAKKLFDPDPPKEEKEGPTAGFFLLMGSQILMESAHSKEVLGQGSQLLDFKNRKDCKARTGEEKVKMIKDHMPGASRGDHPGTPKLNIVVRILKTFVDDLKAKGGGNSSGR